MSKRDEIDGFVRRMACQAIAEIVCELPDGEVEHWLKLNRSYVARMVADQMSAQYGFLELADIMEWRRTRVRR